MKRLLAAMAFVTMAQMASAQVLTSRCTRARHRAIRMCDLAASLATTSTTTTTDPPQCPPTTTTLPACAVCTAEAPMDACVSACRDAVCAEDVTCCTAGWDALCVSEVNTDCCPSGGECCP